MATMTERNLPPMPRFARKRKEAQMQDSAAWETMNVFSLIELQQF